MTEVVTMQLTLIDSEGDEFAFGDSEGNVLVIKALPVTLVPDVPLQITVLDYASVPVRPWHDPAEYIPTKTEVVQFAAYAFGGSSPIKKLWIGFSKLKRKWFRKAL